MIQAVKFVFEFGPLVAGQLCRGNCFCLDATSGAQVVGFVGGPSLTMISDSTDELMFQTTFDNGKITWYFTPVKSGPRVFEAKVKSSKFQGDTTSPPFTVRTP